jgi:hypothetical protein
VKFYPMPGFNFLLGIAVELWCFVQ